MRRARIPALWAAVAWGCIAAAAAPALDPPHDASESIDCANCHISHHAPGGAITTVGGNPNLCMSCHGATGVAFSMPLADADEAIPGASGTSHRWDSGASGWVRPDPANTSRGSVQSGGSFLGRYRKTYTITVSAPGDVGTALFSWTTSKPASETYRDEFTMVAFNGTNGTQPWSANAWQQLVETDGPAAGVIQVVSSAACASGNCLRIGGGTLDTLGAQRLVNLSQGTAATVTFSYRRQLATCPNSSTASVSLQVTPDGTTWSTLAAYNLNACDSGQVTQVFDVTPYLGATTQIRFVGSGTAGTSDFLYVDNVQVEYLAPDGGGTNVTTGSNVSLDEGVTVTFVNGASSPSFLINDHWTVYANPDLNQPTTLALAARLAEGKVTCSTCHNEHSQMAEPFAAAPPYPTLGPGGVGRRYHRIDNDIDQMCVDCHSARNVTASAQGSHPVGVLIPTAGLYKDP